MVLVVLWHISSSLVGIAGQESRSNSRLGTIIDEHPHSTTQFRTSTTFCPRLDLGKFKNDPDGKFHNDPGGGFHSQFGEDRALMGWFNGLCNGTYIEMGALDGVRFSNSFAFNKHLGWKGVLVEPFPFNYKKLAENRPNELALVNAGVCKEKTTLHYFEGSNYVGATGAIWEFSSKSFRDKYWQGKSLEKDAVELTCVPLKDILRKHAKQTTFFDFLSLDVEGAELEVLQSIDYFEVGFGVILVEGDSNNRLKNIAVFTFLEGQGYRVLNVKEDSRAVNWWFFHEHFQDIYGEVMHSHL